MKFLALNTKSVKVRGGIIVGNIQEVPSMCQALNTFPILTPLNLTAIQTGKYYYYLNYLNEETAGKKTKTKTKLK